MKTLCSTLVFFLIVLLIYYSSNNLSSHREEVRVLSEALSLKEALSFKNFKDDDNSKKMDKKLLEENERQTAKLKKLPKPKDIIKVAKGPLVKKKSKMPIMDRITLLLDSMKCSKQDHNRDLLLVLGRPESGLEQFLPLLHKKHGVFVLQDDDSPMTSVKDAIYTLTNLSRCAIITASKVSQESLENFPLHHNTLIVDSCDEECTTSPDLWNQMCQKFNFKALTSNNFDLNVVRGILEKLTIGMFFTLLIANKQLLGIINNLLHHFRCNLHD